MIITMIIFVVHLELQQKVETFIKEETKRKLSPFVLATVGDKSLLQNCSRHPALHFYTGGSCISPTKTICISFGWHSSISSWGQLYICNETITFPPITQSAQRGALETFILCILISSDPTILFTWQVLDEGYRGILNRYQNEITTTFHTCVVLSQKKLTLCCDN